MKRSGLLLLISVIFISLLASDGFSFKLGGKEMVKNGSGNRTRALFGSLYIATLWVPENLKGKSGVEIIDANEPMSMVLLLDSKLITRERFVEATSEGFDKAAASGYTSAKKQAFLDQFKKVEFNKGDTVIMSYTKAGLTTQFTAKETNKTENLGTIPGLDLKKALFSIWLGKNPIQDTLKDALLSGK